MPRTLPALLVGATLGVTLVAAPTTGRAATTIGIEWEMPSLFLAATGADPVFRMTDDGAPPSRSFAPLAAKPKGVVCTKATTTVDNRTFPLVTASMDLGNSANAYILELITGPLPYKLDDPKADPRTPTVATAIASTSEFLAGLKASCEKDGNARIGDDGSCFVDVDTLLTALPSWQRCDPFPIVPTNTKLYVGTRTGWKYGTSDTQVNLAVDLPRLATRSLYTPGERAKEIRDAMLEVIDQESKTRNVAVSPSARALLAMIYQGANIQYWADEQSMTGANAWMVKNLFDLFVKAPLGEIFAKLPADDKSAIRAMMKHLRLNRLRDLCYASRIYPTSIAAKFYCGDFRDYEGTPPRWTAWRSAVIRWENGALYGEPAPLDYAQISNPISPYGPDAAPLVVVESREPRNPLNDALQLEYVSTRGQWQAADLPRAIEILDAYFAP